jgi:hypothetical protein
VFLACSSDDDGGTRVGTDNILGSGNVIEEARTISGVTGVLLSTLGTLHIEQDSSEALRIETDDNIMPHLITEVLGEVLQIHAESGVNLLPTRLDYFLAVMDLDSIVFDGFGDIVLDGFDTTSLSLTHDGVGAVEVLALTADDLDVMASGVGSTIVSGEVDSQTVTVSAVSSYEVEELASRTAEVLIRGDGSATLCVSDELSVTMTGAGSVSYYGDPIFQGDVSASDQLGLTCP